MEQKASRLFGFSEESFESVYSGPPQHRMATSPASELSQVRKDPR